MWYKATELQLLNLIKKIEEIIRNNNISKTELSAKAESFGDLWWLDIRKSRRRHSGAENLRNWWLYLFVEVTIQKFKETTQSSGMVILKSALPLMHAYHIHPVKWIKIPISLLTNQLSVHVSDPTVDIILLLTFLESFEATVHHNPYCKIFRNSHTWKLNFMMQLRDAYPD